MALAILKHVSPLRMAMEGAFFLSRSRAQAALIFEHGKGLIRVQGPINFVASFVGNFVDSAYAMLTAARKNLKNWTLDVRC
jgi:hypothetical protein